MMTTRFAPAVAILLAIALPPTVIHSYLGVELRDGRSSSRIADRLAARQGVATGRKDAWAKRVFKSDDWIERRYVGDGGELLLFVARSYDPKTLYHHPELALLRGVPFGKKTVERLPQSPDTPVHVLTSTDGRQRAVYALLHEQSFIDDPIRFQMQSAAELLFKGRKPMTLFVVHDARLAGDVPLARSPAVGLLFEAIQSFLSQTRATDP